MAPESLVGLSTYVHDFGETILPRPLASFVAHFPVETAELDEYRPKIEEHNRRLVDFRSRIKRDFESRDIPVVNINHPPSDPPYIYDTIFRPLFDWWKDRNQRKANPRPNFEQIETKSDFGPNHLLVAGWGSEAIAYAETDSDKQRCKDALSEVAENKEYEREAAGLVSSANELVKQARTLGRELSDKLGNVAKFWPGTKNYRFKKEKQKCPKCREVFG